MQDFLWKMTQVDDYTLTVVVLLVVAVFCMIRSMLDSFKLAVIFTPLLFFGGLAANYLFRVFYIPTSADKDTAVVIASAVGVLIAMILMLLAVWMAVLMSERRSKKRKIKPLLPIARTSGGDPEAAE